jgi:hypothetical protein
MLSAVLGCAAVTLSACVTSHVLVGRARTPILPSQVQVYLQPPASKYEQIAVLDTSSKHSFSFTAQGKTEVVIRRLKEEAAKLGANGILLQEISDEPVGTVGTGVGTDFASAHGSISLGLSGSGFLLQKFGSGIAIYLETVQATGN